MELSIQPSNAVDIKGRLPKPMPGQKRPADQDQRVPGTDRLHCIGNLTEVKPEVECREVV